MTLPGAAGKALVSLGIETYGDLVEHLPHSHRDRREVRRVADLALGEEATVAVVVRSVSIRPMRDRRRKRVEARTADESGPLMAVWFNQPWIARQLGEGAQVLLHGRLRRRGEFWVSEHEPLGGADAPVHTVGLVPVHPATEGLSAARLRALLWDARGRFLLTPEPLPAGLRVEEALAERAAALVGAHFPDSEDDESGARHRLAFEELLLLQLAVAGRRRSRREGRRARPLAARGVVVDRWRWSLPFELTGDQKRAMEELDADIGEERPMQRLLMGEVGAGKTVVALHAMLRAVENGAQAALMAPTETLAEQHHRTLDRLLGGNIPVELLTGSTPAARRRDLIGALGVGRAAAGRGHARADRGPRRVQGPRRGGGGRAAPLRSAPARGARREGPGGAGPARAAHDRHADPAHALADRLRRPGRDRAARAAGGAPPGGDLRGRRRPGAQARLRAHSRGDRGGPPVLRGLPARRGVRDAPGQGGHGGVRAPALDGVPRPARGADPRPAPVEGQAGRDGGVRRR